MPGQKPHLGIARSNNLKNTTRHINYTIDNSSIKLISVKDFSSFTNLCLESHKTGQYLTTVSVASIHEPTKTLTKMLMKE